MLVFYVIAVIVSFLGVVVNLPGALHLNPILLNFYDAHTVLFLTTIYLGMGALARLFFFWENIVWHEALHLIPGAVIGGTLGAFFVGYIPEKLLIVRWTALSRQRLWVR